MFRRVAAACLCLPALATTSSPPRLQEVIATDLQGDSTALLQLAARGRSHDLHERVHKEEKHYWPHARGRPGDYGHTPWGSLPKDLNKSLAWQSPNFDTKLMSVLIDSHKNLYVAGMDAIRKFSPSGQLLWSSAPLSSESPTLVGDTLVGMQQTDCVFFVLGLETGEVRWKKQLWPTNGVHVDFVEVNAGVAVVGAGMVGEDAEGGSPSQFALGVNISNGDLLWKYEPECGLWNIMALFPDNETTIFSDSCGGVYRLGLQNGTELWHRRGKNASFTDGGTTIGPDGSAYTCSNDENTSGWGQDEGLLTKYRLEDGAQLWQVGLPYPCATFPVVTPDGKTVIVAPGGFATDGVTKTAKGQPEIMQRSLYLQQLSLGQHQRSFYGMPNLGANLMALETDTGKLHWRHEVPPYGGMAWAGEERRNWRWLRNEVNVTSCWPSHWSSPAIGDDGTVYIARSSGDFYAYNPGMDIERTFRYGDGAMLGGPAFAPGMMAFAACSSVFVFHMPT